MLLNWKKKQNKIIKECNHRMDWWIVAFRFCYNKWNDIYSFKYSEIGNSLDGSEDDLFRGYQDIKKGSEIIQIENDSDLYFDGNYVTSSDLDE